MSVWKSPSEVRIQVMRGEWLGRGEISTSREHDFALSREEIRAHATYGDGSSYRLVLPCAIIST